MEETFLAMVKMEKTFLAHVIELFQANIFGTL